MKLNSLVLIASIGVALAAGCDREAKNNVGGNAQQQGADSLPAGLVLASAPGDAQDVTAAKKDAAKDKEVVIKGVIAGSEKPIADGRAVFTLADVSLETCDKMPGDKCKTPWDACCADPAAITAKSVTVQVVGADGKPLKAALNGVGGIAPLKQVVVKGKVSSAEGEGDKKTVTLDASGIYVKS